MDSFPHIPVMLEETVQVLNVSHGHTIMDCTVGAGGHLTRLAEAVGPNGRVIGIDRDKSAIELARKRLERMNLIDRVKLVHGNFSELTSFSENLGLVGKINGILADVGVSSMHLDQSARGFSFQNDGPLDMRMDIQQSLTAEKIVNHWPEDELYRIFRDLGEEPKAHLIARKITQKRSDFSFTSTKQLADFIKDSIHYPTQSRKHPATRIFQALRIAVNDELGELKKLLNTGFQLLSPQGRIAIITFHSLEDRMVKDFLVGLSGKKQIQSIPRDLPLNAAELSRLAPARAEIVKPFPIVPSEKEISSNPRSRSAKLRAAIKNSHINCVP